MRPFYFGKDRQRQTIASRSERAACCFLWSNFNSLASQKNSRCFFSSGWFSNLCSFGAKCRGSNDFCGATFCDGGAFDRDLAAWQIATKNSIVLSALSNAVVISKQYFW